MGCDIHLYVEKKVGDRWVTADQWEPDEDDPERRTVPYEKRFWTGRNYYLFAILADVRNNHGFAGTDGGEQFNVVAPPRGVPEDACPEYKAEVETWGADGHSHSWLGLDELLRFDWTQTNTLRGWVNAEEYAEWIRWRRGRGEGPANYCGGVSGGQVKHVTEDEMKRLLTIYLDPKELAHHYCKVSWELPYHRCCPSFWSELIPRLLRLGEPDDVRIVFFFDN